MALQKQLVAGIYPVQSIELGKPCGLADADAVVEILLRCIEDHPKARLITIFDYLQHIWELGGEIPDGFIAVRNIVFCLDSGLDAPELVALRPRAIGVTEFEDRFVVSYMESPLAEYNATLATWLSGLPVINP